jgi:hypothetical protein
MGRMGSAGPGEQLGIRRPAAARPLLFVLCHLSFVIAAAAAPQRGCCWVRQ